MLFCYIISHHSHGGGWFEFVAGGVQNFDQVDVVEFMGDEHSPECLNHHFFFKSLILTFIYVI